MAEKFCAILSNEEEMIRKVFGCARVGVGVGVGVGEGVDVVVGNVGVSVGVDARLPPNPVCLLKVP